MDNDEKEYSASWWKDQITQAEKWLDEGWRRDAMKAVDRYRDKRKIDDQGYEYGYNIFWANVGILKAALYGQPPRPMVARQFQDAKDDVARVSANILERMLQNDFTKDKSQVNTTLRHAVEDRLVPGLGQLWAIYEPKIVKQKLQDGTEFEKIVDEKVHYEYVPWRDFIWPSSRVWEDVPWVSRRVWMTHTKFQKRFGDKAYQQYRNSVQKNSENNELPKGFTKKRIETFETWCLETKKVYHTCLDVMLDEKPDPYQYPGFFPCPRPMASNTTTTEFLPKADYMMVRDQYVELDNLTSRIYLLEQAMRVVGVYDKTNPELQNIIAEALENDMIAVENWGNLSEKGGLKGVVDWFPIEVIAAAIDKLRQQKADKIQEIYELTGISDIMRGASAPRETAAAQKLKAQYSSVRLQYSQNEVALFVQDILKIKAWIIRKLFQPETIVKQSGIMMTEDAQLAEKAVEFLKADDGVEYRVEVSEESLALPDYNSERDSRVEYLTTVGQFVSQVQGLVETKPEAGPYLMSMVQWVTAGFRGSKEIESTLDAAFQAMQQPQPPKPDPEAEKAKQEMQLKQQEAQLKMQLEQQKLEHQKAMDAAKLEHEKQMMQLKFRMEVAKMKLDLSLEQEKMIHTANLEEQKLHNQTRLEVQKAEAGFGLEHRKVEVGAEFEDKKLKLAAREDSLLQGIAQIGEALVAAQEQMANLQKLIKSPRKRVPVRDADGNIVEVLDTVEEENA
jgi:hypothetical protein